MTSRSAQFGPLLLVLALLVFSRVVTPSRKNAAGGILAWCNMREAGYPEGFTRYNYTRGAWACVGFFSNQINPSSADWTGCPTSDSWGLNPSQCMLPGYNPLSNSANYLVEDEVPGYPSTFDRQADCNQAVFTSPLVDDLGLKYMFKDYMFKDYAGTLYITASLDAYMANGGSGGQWWHNQPAMPTFVNNLPDVSPLSDPRAPSRFPEASTPLCARPTSTN